MALNKLRIDALDDIVNGQRIFLRVDFDLHQDKSKSDIITDIQRIDAAIPTIKYCLLQGCKSVVVAGHLGRPDGCVVEKYSLAPVAKVLQEKLGQEVTFLNDCAGPDVEKACADPTPGSVIPLENLRYHVEEDGKGVDKDGKEIKADKEDVRKFRESLAKLADIHVNDTFGSGFVEQSSMVGEGYAWTCSGFHLDKEQDALAKVLAAPARPVLAIIGGEVRDNMELIMHMIDKVEMMIIGGSLALTFLKVIEGMDIGASHFDEEGSKRVPKIIQKAKVKKVQMIFPVDFICSSTLGEDGEIKVGNINTGVPTGFMSLDCGPDSLALFHASMQKAETIVWHGAIGAFEMEKFRAGTESMMAKIVEATKKGTKTVISGGDMATACNMFNAEDKVTHCSTGGSASLELLKSKANKMHWHGRQLFKPLKASMPDNSQEQATSAEVGDKQRPDTITTMFKKEEHKHHAEDEANKAKAVSENDCSTVLTTSNATVLATSNEEKLKDTFEACDKECLHQALQ